jgi:hypothetical protein
MKQLIFYLLIIFLISGTVFGQSPALFLDSTDIREEPAEYNGVAGYNIFVRQKLGMESIMLTEPNGFHALRATEWNPINGNEKRRLSGVALSDFYSQYSIVSSTPIPDLQFGRAFQLFLPLRVVYGNPSSSTGTVFLNIREGNQINIRTFDNKYADPNRGKFQNNQYSTNGTLVLYREPMPMPQSAMPPEENDPIKYVRMGLQGILVDTKIINDMDDDELKKFLITVFLEKEREQ